MRASLPMLLVASASLVAPALATAQPADIPIVDEPVSATGEAAPGESTEVPAEPDAAPSEPEDAPLVLHHKHQGNVRFTFGTGYRFIVPYEDDAICGPDLDTSPCESRAPWFLDLDAGFGASEGVELTFMLRLGLESEDLGGATPLVVGPGIRLYPSADGRVKLFLAFRVLIDFTKVGPKQPGRDLTEKTDVALRGEPGLQVEINRYVGVYLQTGVTFGAVRWFHFAADGGLGLQVRFP